MDANFWGPDIVKQIAELTSTFNEYQKELKEQKEYPLLHNGCSVSASIRPKSATLEKPELPSRRVSVL